MKVSIHCLLVVLITLTLPSSLWANESSSEVAQGGEYSMVVEGYDWGPGVSRVILSLDTAVSTVDWKDYTVFANRASDCFELPAALASGQREVIHAYVSDAQGANYDQEKFVTLVLSVAPNMPISSPIQYSRNEKCRGNNWIDYQLTVIQNSTGKVWNSEANRIVKPIEHFDLSGKFSDQGIALSYASFAPKKTEGKSPLIIWLHGGGEGGTDPSIPLIANRAANLASDEIQSFFSGAYLLVPQTPTRWMDAGNGQTTWGETDDIYHAPLMALIRQFVADHPDIDPARIYVGGCSNGGYMTLKLLLEHPDYFAAAFPSALAYYSENLTDRQVDSIKDIPIWFVHSKDDSVTEPDKTVVPLHKRLMAAGAQNIIFSYYDHVVDITGFFGGEDYRYSGHWSWIYSHANKSRHDLNGAPVMLDGRPVTIMEWLAAQSK